jgi:PadR family transcriptional regulator PadR
VGPAIVSIFDNEMQKRSKTGGQVRRDQDLYAGLIRLHILHHAAKEPVFGLWFIEELGRHGYKLSPGTLYPLLHSLEGKGYLESFVERSGKSSRRMYQATPLGRAALEGARQKITELFGELLEDDRSLDAPLARKTQWPDIHETKSKSPLSK